MPVSQFQNPPLLLVGILFGATLLFSACAGIPAGTAPPGAAQTREAQAVKENSEEGLKLSQENRLEMQTLAARLRELEGQLQLLSDQIALLPLDKIRDHDRRLDTLQARMAARGAKNPGSSKPAAVKPFPTFSTVPVDESAPATAPSSAPPPVPAATQTRKGVSGPEAALYRKAYDLYAGRNYSEAIKAFEELQVKFPQGAYADNAEYWVGESHYAQGNYAKAMASFRKVMAYPGTEKDDDAQLKIGYCRLRQGDRKQAAEEFRKVVSLFPGSEYLERAKDELTRLESSGP